jgi:NAD-dependent SIR2 family protein deacetylase
VKILLFAGAGTSIELGVPAMHGMAHEFLNHVEQWNVEPDLVSRLIGDPKDVEVLIEKLDQICSARDPLHSIGEDLVLDKFETIRAEVEWFVQHVAERISPSNAHLMWGPVLRASGKHQLTFVTTNYDRAIELAANAEGIQLNDGYDPFSEREVASWRGFESGPQTALLVKLHGSTDWYADSKSEDPLKLRHPMPLFGRSLLRLANGTELGTALIFPSREKLLSKMPYSFLTHAFYEAVKNCDVAIFVGSSMRDAHVRAAAKQWAKTKPVVIVNPTGDTLSIEGAYPIAQTAGLFLVSTLPSALTADDALKQLQQSSKGSQKPISVLDLLRIAVDPNESTQRRCAVIEELDASDVSLDEYLINSILAGKDSVVARYALGLIPASPSRDSALAKAAASAHLHDPSFEEEFTLLKRLVSAS